MDLSLSFFSNFSFEADLMAQTDQDRWIARILVLPVFHESFAQAVRESQLSSLAFVASLEVGSAEAFVQKVMELLPAFGPEVQRKLEGQEVLLAQFWSLACSVEKAFFQSMAFQLRFGLCESRVVAPSLDANATLRKQSAIAALLNRQCAPPKKAKLSVEPASSATPLLDKEKSERWKWAIRLEAIGKRAGAHAKLFKESEDQGDLSQSELWQLRQMVLASGAHRTLAAHVQAFERFEHWAAAQDFPLYPLSVEKLLKFCLKLDQEGCGPSVIPSFKTAVKWVCSRLAIDVPDLEDQRLTALQKQIVVDRAKTLKEAVPIPITAVAALERLVLSDQVPEQARVFIWWLLCMIFASLRFDDAIHVKPQELTMKDEGLFGVSWQSKVERKRAGTRFMVPHVGFSTDDWLLVGWSLFNQILLSDRDFWVPELNSQTEFKSDPPTYSRTLQWLKYFARKAVDVSPDLAQAQKVLDARVINTLTNHSCRVTLLDAAVHAGRSTEEIGLQANWKNPGPLVLKYTRNRSSVPAVMIKQLVRELVQEQHPTEVVGDATLVDADDQDLGTVEFFIKTPAPGSYYEYKFHCISSSDRTALACGKFVVDECSAVGTCLPSTDVFCKACARARPEVVSFYTQKPA